MSKYDVIIAGAGSIGVPAAMALGKMGIKTLVLDQHPSPGQGENKHAIGGVRATHSDPAKILLGLRSLEVFSTWEKKYGDNIEWLKGGYLFPVYREKEEKALKGILPIQKKYGLNIDFIDSDQVKDIVPGINDTNLTGGTFSPEDGSVSPLLAINAFYRKALEKDVCFEFNTTVDKIIVEQGKAVGVYSGNEKFEAPVVVDAAGAYSRKLCKTAGVDIPVIPDSHEGAITEPVQNFFKCMIVDLRPEPGSKNFYFYQNGHGQVIFCITPDPPIVGMDKRETSVFLPQIAARMLTLIPRLKNLRVRRVWRGLYPMTPDGFPIVGWNREVKGLLHATGMCGQGFMLGPGTGEVVARAINKSGTDEDKVILDQLTPYREFAGTGEALK